MVTYLDSWNETPALTGFHSSSLVFTWSKSSMQQISSAHCAICGRYWTQLQNPTETKLFSCCIEPLPQRNPASFALWSNPLPCFIIPDTAHYTCRISYPPSLSNAYACTPIMGFSMNSSDSSKIEVDWIFQKQFRHSCQTPQFPGNPAKLLCKLWAVACSGSITPGHREGNATTWKGLFI